LRPCKFGAANFRLIGVAAGVIDRAHEVDQRAGGVVGAAHDLHHDGVVAEFEQAPLLRVGGARAQSLHAACDDQPPLREQAIKRETRRRGGLLRQSDPAHDVRREHGRVNRGRHAVYEPKPVETDQLLRRRIGEIVAPRRVAEAEQQMARHAPLRLDGVGEAREIRRLAAERRRRHETAETLPAPDQPFLDEPLDGAADREAADAEAPRQRRLAVDAVARPLQRDLGAQHVDELQIERPIEVGVQRGAHGL